MAIATKRQAMSVDIFGTTLTVTFSNGKDLAIDVAKLTPEIQRMAMLHGIKQKLVDAAAMSRDGNNLNSNQVESKYEAVAAVHARLTSDKPTWNKERAAPGTPTNGKNLLVRALMQMTGRDKDYVDAFLTSKTKEEREALKRNPRVLAIIAELQAATVSNGVDTDDLLEQLGAETHSGRDVGDSDDAENVEDDESSEAFTPAPTLAQAVQETVQKKRAAPRKRATA